MTTLAPNPPRLARPRRPEPQRPRPALAAAARPQLAFTPAKPALFAPPAACARNDFLVVNLRPELLAPPAVPPRVFTGIYPVDLP